MRNKSILRLALTYAMLAEAGERAQRHTVKSNTSISNVPSVQRQAPKKKQKCIKKQHKPNSQYKSSKPLKSKAVSQFRNKSNI